MTAKVDETNGLGDNAHAYHDARRNVSRKVPWTEPGLRITRLRLLSDPGFPLWDLSYCHGTIGDEHVDVELPFDQLEKGKSIRSQIIAYAQADGIDAVGIGALDAISTLN